MKPRRRLALEYAIVFLVIALLGVFVNVALAVYQSTRPPMATLSPILGGYS